MNIKYILLIDECFLTMIEYCVYGKNKWEKLEENFINVVCLNWWGILMDSGSAYKLVDWFFWDLLIGIETWVAFLGVETKGERWNQSKSRQGCDNF